jgi:hypothetical protein
MKHERNRDKKTVCLYLFREHLKREIIKLKLKLRNISSIPSPLFGRENLKQNVLGEMFKGEKIKVFEKSVRKWINHLTPNDLQRRRAVSPLKIKILSKNSRQATLRGGI